MKPAQVTDSPPAVDTLPQSELTVALKFRADSARSSNKLADAPVYKSTSWGYGVLVSRHTNRDMASFPAARWAMWCCLGLLALSVAFCWAGRNAADFQPAAANLGLADPLLPRTIAQLEMQGNGDVLRFERERVRTWNGTAPHPPRDLQASEGEEDGEDSEKESLPQVSPGFSLAHASRTLRSGAPRPAGALLIVSHPGRATGSPRGPPA